MKDKLIIIGASGHGKVIADIALKMNKWKSIAFLDDDQSIKTVMGLDVIGRTTETVKFQDDANFIVAIGNNTTRKNIQENLLNSGLSIVSLIHPSAIIGANVEIGIGTVVMGGVVINSSSRIGKGCIINTSASIDHDNFISDYVHISPGVRLAGNVRVGQDAWLGIGSVVSNNISICGRCTFGAGAVVVSDVNVPGTYVGVPVRKID